MPPKSDRNRQIFAAYEAGQTMQQLGDEHALTFQRIRAVLTDEKHKRIVSLKPFYRALRGS
jgi:Mor family transcriptional regulator